jgi:hypothetical protein
MGNYLPFAVFCAGATGSLLPVSEPEYGSALAHKPPVAPAERAAHLAAVFGSSSATLRGNVPLCPRTCGSYISSTVAGGST